MGDALARAMALFDEYVAMSPQRRADALASLRRREADAHDALVTLLASDDALQSPDAPPLLDSPPEAVLAQHDWMQRGPKDSRVNTRLGAWRITGVVGAGGMGTVYEAWRDDGQYTQRVALKCIRAELSSESLIESFRREREILAGLDHANIATLFDGGVDGQGSPWFAMRYVDGVPVDDWCDQRKLGLRERVTLLVHACDALIYAHQHMVLHLDIKPSNLLVTEAGQLQLLDFGLAASLAAAEHDPRIAASEGYTAPEAFSGAPPSVGMDIWSLGMVMYRLLCGSLSQTPRLLGVLRGDNERPTPDPMSHRVLHLDDAVAHARGFKDVHALSRRLAGDLDAIASRCIAWQPEQRYPSVVSLRDDLACWLATRPVQARHGGTGYRMSRFVQRNRLATGLAAAALIAIATGGGIALWHAQRAARDAASTAALSRVFEQTVGSATLSGLGDTPMSSQALLEQTERRVRALSLQDHPRVLALGLSSLARSHAVAGDYEHAMRLSGEAAALLGNDPTSRAAAMATRASMSNLLGKPSEALRLAEAALADADTPTRIQLITETARSHWNLADYGAAVSAIDSALALARKERDVAAQAELLTLRGYWRTRQFRFHEADTDLADARNMSASDFPLVANEARRVTALSLQWQERLDESRPLIEESLTTARRVLGEHHPTTGRAWIGMANHQCFEGKHEACVDSIARAETIVLAQQGDQHPDYAEVLRIRSYASPIGNQAFEEGIRQLRQAEQIISARYPPTHEATERIRMMLGRRLMVSYRIAPEHRQRYFGEGLALLEALAKDPRRAGLPALPIFRAILAEAYLTRDRPGDLALARGLLADNTVVLRAFPPGHSGHFINAQMESVLDAKEGRLDRAEERLVRMTPLLLAHQDASNNRFVMRDYLLLRAEIAQARNDAGQVRTLLQQCLAFTEATFGADHHATRHVRDRIDSYERTGKLPSNF